MSPTSSTGTLVVNRVGAGYREKFRSRSSDGGLTAPFDRKDTQQARKLGLMQDRGFGVRGGVVLSQRAKGYGFRQVNV